MCNMSGITCYWILQKQMTQKEGKVSIIKLNFVQNHHTQSGGCEVQLEEETCRHGTHHS